MREQFASQIEVSSFPSTSPQDYASLVIPGRKLVLTFEREWEAGGADQVGERGND